MNRCFIAFSFSLLLFSCSDKYKPFQSNYTFKTKGGCPDYSDLNYWAAHPWKWDPSDSVPKPLRNEPRDTSVDVFFVHPTTYTKNIKSDNASIDDDYLCSKTDYSSILYQASVFNQHARVFSPRYRQASIEIFFQEDEHKTWVALDSAYSDVKKAFEYYLQYWNAGRPIIIAGHSQGSLLAQRLLNDFFDNKSLQKQLVVAYVPGWWIADYSFKSIKVCADSLATGCICGWRTMRNNYVPSYFKSKKLASPVTNPLTWTTTEVYAPRSLNKGSILLRFNKIYKKTTDASVKDGLLYVNKPRFPWSFLYFQKNYHVGDINLFYMNIRENISQRIISFKKN